MSPDTRLIFVNMKIIGILAAINNHSDYVLRSEYLDIRRPAVPGLNEPVIFVFRNCSEAVSPHFSEHKCLPVTYQHNPTRTTAERPPESIPCKRCQPPERSSFAFIYRYVYDGVRFVCRKYDAVVGLQFVQSVCDAAILQGRHPPTVELFVFWAQVHAVVVADQPYD